MKRPSPNVPRHADERDPLRVVARFLPFGAIAVGDDAHGFGRRVADHVEAAGRREFGTLRIRQAVPDGRVGALERRQLQRYVLEAVIAALERQRAAAQRLQDHLPRLEVHRLRFRRIDAEMLDLDRRNAAPDAQLEAPAAQLVEHADFLRQAQRVIQGERVDQRAEAQPFGALRDRRQEHAGRGRHAERRSVMLGQVIGVEAGRIVELDQLEPRLVIRVERDVVAVEMVENAEFHACSPMMAHPTCHRFPSASRGAANCAPAQNHAVNAAPNRSFS